MVEVGGAFPGPGGPVPVSRNPVAPTVEPLVLLRGSILRRDGVAEKEEHEGEDVAEDIEQSIAVMRRARHMLRACARLTSSAGTDGVELRLMRGLAEDLGQHARSGEALLRLVERAAAHEDAPLAVIRRDLAVSARRSFALAALLLERRQARRAAAGLPDAPVPDPAIPVATH